MLTGTRAKHAEIFRIVSNSMISEMEKCNLLEELLESDPHEIYKTDPNGNCALHLAAQFSLPDVTKLLIRYNCSINLKNQKGMTPLHCAAFAGAEVVLLILSTQPKIEINAVDTQNETALHKAAYAKSPACIKILASKKEIEIDIANKRGETARNLIESWQGSHQYPDLKQTLASTMQILPITNALEVEQYYFPSASVSLDSKLLKKLIRQFERLNLDSTIESDNLMTLSSERKKNVRITLTNTLKKANTINLSEADFQGDGTTVEKFLQAGGNANTTLAPHDTPLLYYAFIHKQKMLFVKLVLAGASIECVVNAFKAMDNDSANFMSEVQTELHSQAIVEMESFEAKARDRSAEFQRCLIANRFARTFSEQAIVKIGDNLKGESKCVQSLYYLSCGLKKEKIREFDNVYVSQSVMGLLDKFDPNEILDGLITLTPKLSNIQKLICLYIFKEMLFYNLEFAYPLNKNFSDKLKDFLEKNYEKKLNVSLLKLFKVIKQYSENSIFRVYIRLNQLIAFYPFQREISIQWHIIEASNPLNIQNKQNLEAYATYLALEMRRIMLQFFLVCDLKEFKGKVWDLEKKHREIDSPHFVKMLDFLEKLREYFFNLMMDQKTLQERANVFTFFIYTARKCLSTINEISVDANSVFAILGAVNKISQDFPAILNLLDKKTKKIYSQLNELCRPHRNFLNLRRLMKCCAVPLPYFVVLCHDKTMLADSDDPDLNVLGGIYHSIGQIKIKIRLLTTSGQSDLLRKVLKQNDKLELPHDAQRNSLLRLQDEKPKLSSLPETTEAIQDLAKLLTPTFSHQKEKSLGKVSEKSEASPKEKTPNKSRHSYSATS